MKKFVLFGAFSAILLGALWLANHKRQQTPAYILSRYPPSANMTYVIEHHLRPANAVIFRSDWFDRDTTGSAMGCETQSDGSETCAIYSENLASTLGVSGRSPADLARFQTILRALPPGETAPPLHRLLIVSLRDGPTWTTRIYDRAHLPPQIAGAAEIGGFRGLQN